MAELFSAEWMQSFQEAWNAEPKLAGALEKISFSSRIAYGIKGADQPLGVLIVENGQAIEGRSYQEGESLSWDIRGSEKDWNKWLKKGIGLVGLGMAYTTGKMKFVVGDYGAMIKDPRMAGPFIESFSVMAKLS